MNKPAKAAAEVKVAPEPKASPRRAEEPPFAVHPGAIAAIVAATHGDPFSVLGPHRVGHDLYEIRAMLPGAAEVRALSVQGGDLLCELKRVDPSGFFCGRVSSVHRPYYKLEIAWPRETRVEWDPYSFGPVLASDDFSAVEDIGTSRFYNVFGAHMVEHGNVTGGRFVVWAPNAHNVSVVGDFNIWDGRRHPMRLRHETGIWELFVPELPQGQRYKYEMRDPSGRLLPLKADPVAFRAEHPPATASVLHGLPKKPQWHDEGWIEGRGAPQPRKRPISIYECHLGSWARVPEEGNRYLSYKEFGERLIPYVRDLGFTHIELLPVTEYPFDGSWGYQPISLYAPTCRFGTPEEFAEFVESAHAAGIGVLLDWVPAHFPNDPHGLARFDGTHLYEHADPRQGFHQDWGTHIYNLGRREVMAFLVSNARFWLEQYHLDGLRVDAVASMLYLDYSRRPGEWVPNRYGGNENLEAIDFLRRMNEVAYETKPGVFTVAEESTAWPGVSQPTYTGGLGFGFKWNMGWMHDTLRYMSKEPIHRRYHHHDMTFGMVYAFSENFILPLSHDEVVHGKGSLLGRMPGDRWQRFANLRAYFGFMWGHPGKKLLFMGGEFGQEREWNHDRSLDWHLLADGNHKGVQSLVRDLNHIYRETPALHAGDCEDSGFRWLIGDDRDNSVLAFARYGNQPDDVVIVISNFTPVPRENYRVGAPQPGAWHAIVNTDAAQYGGTSPERLPPFHTSDEPSHGHPWSLVMKLPPLSTMILQRRG